MLSRAVRAAMLDRRVYQQLSLDGTATADAVLLVAGIGVVLFVASALRVGVPLGGWLVGILQSAIFTCASWLFTAFAVWLIGSRLFHGSGSMEPVIRLHGFAHLPLLLSVVPVQAAAVAGLIWFLAALVVATREALDLDVRRALASVLLGFALLTIVSLVLRVPFVAVQGLLGLAG